MSDHEDDVDEGSLASGSDAGELSDRSDEGDNDESMEMGDAAGSFSDHEDQRTFMPINEEEDAASSDDDDEKQGEPSSSPEPPSKTTRLGGMNSSNGTPAYALLVGMIDPTTKTNDGSDDDEDSSNNGIISIPITRLPVTLGKEHDTRDPSFIGLKESTAEATDSTMRLSQSMCCIYYRDAHGGKLGLYRKGRRKDHPDGEEASEADPLDGMIYKPYENTSATGGGGDESTEKSTHPLHPLPEDILRLPGMDEKAPLPSRGFFAIECLGRKIMVGGRIIKKGQCAMLKDGIPIRIAAHCFYFLLPTESEPQIRVKVATAAMSPTKPVIKQQPEKIVSSTKATTTIVDKKKERESMGEDDASTQQQQPPPAKKSRKSEEYSLFDDKTDAELIQLLASKVTEEGWDGEGQRLGTTLALRACQAAAKSPALQSIARTQGGVTQREIVDWMNEPTCIFKDYEELMRVKIEKKSVMMSIGKAIIRAGYKKNETLTGRAFRWHLPQDSPSGGSLPAGSGGGEEGAAALSSLGGTQINTKENAPTLSKDGDDAEEGATG